MLTFYPVSNRAATAMTASGAPLRLRDSLLWLWASYRRTAELGERAGGKGRRIESQAFDAREVRSSDLARGFHVFRVILVID